MWSPDTDDTQTPLETRTETDRNSNDNDNIDLRGDSALDVADQLNDSKQTVIDNACDGHNVGVRAENLSNPGLESSETQDFDGAEQSRADRDQSLIENIVEQILQKHAEDLDNPLSSVNENTVEKQNTTIVTFGNSVNEMSTIEMSNSFTMPSETMHLIEHYAPSLEKNLKTSKLVKLHPNTKAKVKEFLTEKTKKIQMTKVTTVPVSKPLISQIGQQGRLSTKLASVGSTRSSDNARMKLTTTQNVKPLKKGTLTPSHNQLQVISPRKNESTATDAQKVTNGGRSYTDLLKRKLQKFNTNVKKTELSETTDSTKENLRMKKFGSVEATPKQWVEKLLPVHQQIWKCFIDDNIEKPGISEDAQVAFLSAQVPSEKPIESVSDSVALLQTEFSKTQQNFETVFCSCNNGILEQSKFSIANVELDDQMVNSRNDRDQETTKVIPVCETANMAQLNITDLRDTAVNQCTSPVVDCESSCVEESEKDHLTDNLQTGESDKQIEEIDVNYPTERCHDQTNEKHQDHTVVVDIEPSSHVSAPDSVLDAIIEQIQECSLSSPTSSPTIETSAVSPVEQDSQPPLIEKIDEDSYKMMKRIAEIQADSVGHFEPYFQSVPHGTPADAAMASGFPPEAANEGHAFRDQHGHQYQHRHPKHNQQGSGYRRRGYKPPANNWGPMNTNPLSYHDNDGGMLTNQQVYHDIGGAMYTNQPRYHDNDGSSFYSIEAPGAQYTNQSPNAPYNSPYGGTYYDYYPAYGHPAANNTNYPQSGEPFMAGYQVQHPDSPAATGGVGEQSHQQTSHRRSKRSKKWRNRQKQ